MATDKTEELQNQARDILRAQQEAYLNAVKAWRAAMAAGQQNIPWPQFPKIEMMPTAAEVAEASYAFAAKLLADQSRFMEELSRAMAPPPDKKA